VEVNGISAEISADGSFIAQILLSKNNAGTIKATATSGDEKDTYSWAYSIDNGGTLNFIPGQHVDDYSRISVDPSIDIKSDETIDINLSLRTGKDIGYIHPVYQLEISRVRSLGDRNELPALPGLEFNISPISFKVYPWINYHPNIQIVTNGDLETGDYYFHFNSYLDNRLWSESWVTVEVK